LYRVLEFARGASNPQALSRIEDLCIRYGVPIEADTSFTTLGIEDDAQIEDDDDD